MTAQQLAFGADFDDYSDIAIPEPVEEPTPLTHCHCPRCTARLNLDRTGVSGCAICGYEDYAGAGRIDTGATGSSSLPEAERRTGEKSADTRHYRPRGAHYIATSERKGKPTMKDNPNRRAGRCVHCGTIIEEFSAKEWTKAVRAPCPSCKRNW